MVKMDIPLPSIVMDMLCICRKPLLYSWHKQGISFHNEVYLYFSIESRLLQQPLILLPANTLTPVDYRQGHLDKVTNIPLDQQNDKESPQHQTSFYTLVGFADQQ